MESVNPAMLIMLSPELLLLILSYLDIPDLLSCSRTCHLLRTLSLDPLLHSSRLHRAFITLNNYLPVRPSLSELMVQRIYVTRTTLTARSLGRNLIKIKLSRQLSKRPSAESLVSRGVLPAECFRYCNGSAHAGRDYKSGYMGLAPGLVETKRKIERERVKDVLRSWIEDWRRRGSDSREGEAENQRPDVRRIARKFARDSKAGEKEKESRWGKTARRERELPTRAKVLGLKRFWEKVAREGSTC
jgi:hypothetical protein